MLLNPNQRKILAAMELRARDSFKQLANATKLSEQLVQYHVRKAEESGFVLGYKALIDSALIGYSCHLIYFRFFGLTSAEENAWSSRTLKIPGVTLVARNVGRWDATLGVVARDQVELNDLLSLITKSVSGRIVEMTVTTEVECHYSSTKILSDLPPVHRSTKNPIVFRPVDELDVKILRELATNCRIPTSTLSNKLGLSAPAVQNRIKKLEADSVILGYWARYDYETLGYTHFRVHLKVADTSMAMFDRIKKEVLLTGNVQSASRYLGYADADFRCYSKSLAELSNLISRIRDKFVRDIVQAEVSPVFMWPNINFLPI